MIRGVVVFMYKCCLKVFRSHCRFLVRNMVFQVGDKPGSAEMLRVR